MSASSQTITTFSEGIDAIVSQIELQEERVLANSLEILQNALKRKRDVIIKKVKDGAIVEPGRFGISIIEEWRAELLSQTDTEETWRRYLVYDLRVKSEKCHCL